ncbi:MAG: ATPase, partial [Bacillota bacterium]|nr:ATPase [Bacillota bacterium]
MQKGRAKHVFPGAITPQGFFSYYSYIIDLETAYKTVVIKGGPGVGKSTFMKKIGSEMQDRGFDIEYMHCSSDNNSLDGVVIPKLGYAFLDGTAPHVVDPKYPGAVDEIINFGEFWNEDGIREHKDEVIHDSKAATQFFTRAYKFLKAAWAVYEDSAVINGWALEKGKLNALAMELINELFGEKPAADVEGKQRRLFGSAITPDGFRNYLDSVLDQRRVYEIKGGLATGEDILLDKINNAAIERGYYVEAYFCPLNPNKIEHLVIPGLDISFMTSNAYHSASVPKYIIIDIKQYQKKDILDKYNDDLIQNHEEFDNLLSIALLSVSRAKAVHDRLETYYVPNIDFNAINKCLEKTLSGLPK